MKSEKDLFDIGHRSNSETGLDIEIEKLKTKYDEQHANNNPLKYYTGLRLHRKLADKYTKQHSYVNAINEYYKAIVQAENRIKELNLHGQSGKVGEISTSDLISNSKGYIRECIFKIVELRLSRTDIINNKIEEQILKINKDIAPRIHTLSNEEIFEAIEHGQIQFTCNYIHILVNSDHNLEYLINPSNYYFIDHEELDSKLNLIFMLIVKELKNSANKDPKIAEICYKYRSKSAEYYKKLNDIKNYYEELSSALLYKVYTSKSIDEYNENYADLEDLLTEWEMQKGAPTDEPFFKRSYGSIYGLKFLKPNDTKQRVIQLKLINYYISQTTIKSKNIYKLYENYYLLLSRIQNAKNISEIDIPKQNKFDVDDTIKSDIQLAKQNNRDLIKIIKVCKKNSTNAHILNEDIASISRLYISNIIEDQAALKLLKIVCAKILGTEVVPLTILDEQNDEKIVYDILRLGESTIVEVKKSLNDFESIGRAVSAFSNTRGGQIVIGLDEVKKQHDDSDEMITNEFRVVGINTDKATLDYQKKRLASHLHDAGIDVEDLIIDSTLVIKEKIICVIEVPCQRSIKPVFYHQELYKRVGSENKRLSAKDAIVEMSKINSNNLRGE